jgi:hypothetical protein
MARRRFRIFGKGAGEGSGGPGQAEPSAATHPSPRAAAFGSDARDWTVGDDPAGPATAAGAPEEDAEAPVPDELQANGASRSPGPVPDAAEWLLGDDRGSAVVERGAEQATRRAQRSDEADSNSIAAMAAEAESLAAESEATTASEPVLEPPSWVAAGPRPAARSAPEPKGETNPEPERETKPEPERETKPEPERETMPEPEPQRRSPATPEPDQAGEDRLSLSLAEFEELRGLGMSVTQAKRVIRYRDERNGFRTLDELDQVPGFPRSFLIGVKERVVP